jgi:hypothetical protein
LPGLVCQVSDGASHLTPDHTIPKGSKPIAGGKRSATTGWGGRVSVDPEGIAELTRKPRSSPIL